MIELDVERQRMAQSYSSAAALYRAKRQGPFERYATVIRDFFVGQCLDRGQRVLDLGSGPGQDSVKFRDAGLEPLCVDFAPGMVAACRELGLDAVELDFASDALPASQFAGAWMSFSLLHVSKAEAPRVIASVARALVRRGCICVSLFEGDGEGVRHNDAAHFKYPRYFSYYQLPELRELLQPEFIITWESRYVSTPRPTITVMGKRR